MQYTPSKWGREFHALTTDEALGGGTQGGGKSVVLLNDANAQIVVQHERCVRKEFEWGKAPGWALHLRRELPMLKQTIWRSKLYFPTLSPGCKYNETDHMWTFPSGFKYQFGHLSDSTSFMGYRSNEYTWLGIDEAVEIPEKDMYDELSLRVRTTDPVLAKMKKVRLMSNPGGGWVRDYFVAPDRRGRVVYKRRIKLGDGTEGTRTRIFLPAFLSDNPDAEFRRAQEIALRDKPWHIKAALFDGDWYVVAGAFFAEMWDPAKVIREPFRIPPGWKRFRSGDWGYKSPCVILWWAVSGDGELVCYRERTFNGPKQPKKDAIDVAEAIKEVEQRNGEWDNVRNKSRLTGPMDTNLWGEIGMRGGEGMSAADDMASRGVYWQKARKGRQQAALQMLKRLNDTHGLTGRPAIQFFNTCIKSIETIPALGTDPNDPEAPEKCDLDHWYDAASYACAANPLPTGKEDVAPYYDEIEQYEEEPRTVRGYCH